MISKKLQRYILENAPDLSVVEQVGRNIFYLAPTDHILSGFLIDNGPNYIYFCRVVQPMCDRVSFIGPGFGGHLAGRSAEILGGGTIGEVGLAFIEAVQAGLDLSLTLKGIENFLTAFRQSPALNNMIYRRVYANCLVVHGEFDEAERDLVEVMAEIESTYGFYGKEFDIDVTFRQDTKRILNALRKSPADAQLLLLAWELENKTKYGIF